MCAGNVSAVSARWTRSVNHYGYTTDQAGPTGGTEEIKLEYHYRVPFTCTWYASGRDGSWLCVSLLTSPTTADSARLFVTCVRNSDLAPEHDSGYTEFIDDIMNQDKAVVLSVRPEEIPVDLREELHIKVPDAAGITLRKFLGKVEGRESVA